MADITRRRGDTKSIIFRFVVDGVAMILDGCTFIMTVDPEKSPENATNNILQLTGIALTDGKVEFALTEEQANILPGSYYYDVQINSCN